MSRDDRHETTRETLISRIARLRVTYDATTEGGPSHVFFKTQRDGADPALREFGREEVVFYDVVAEPARQWHLLLEDLTAYHEALGDWPLPPSIERLHAVLAVHARFHAAWWNDARLGVSVGVVPDDPGALDRVLATLPKELATFADRLGDRLSAERKQLYERLLASAAAARAIPLAPGPDRRPRRCPRLERATPAESPARRRAADRLGRVARGHGHRRPRLHGSPRAS
jgi:hypothetical protein